MFNEMDISNGVPDSHVDIDELWIKLHPTEKPTQSPSLPPTASPTKAPQTGSSAASDTNALQTGSSSASPAEQQVVEICANCHDAKKCDDASSELKSDVCDALVLAGDKTSCINQIEATVKKAQASDYPLCAQEKRRLHYVDPGYYIIRANAPPGYNLPKDICDRMGLDNCRSGTVSRAGVFTANTSPMNQDEADGSSGLNGAEMALVLLGSICGLCILAMIAYLVYLAYRPQQQQCEPQEGRCRGPVCRVDPNDRCVRINVPAYAC